MPRIMPDDHLGRPWRVHAIADDFQLLDVWDYPIRASPPDDLAAFAALTRRVEKNVAQGWGPAGLLFRLRGWMGRVFGWDKNTTRLPIPGCSETTLRARLAPGEASDEQPDPESLGFEPVYTKADERLLEISNDTVHALLHLSWIPSDDGTSTPRMAVYVKPRGRFGAAYMGLISPFRHLVVYPTLMRRMAAAWEARS